MTDKKLVRREAPTSRRAFDRSLFWEQGLRDLAAGRHAEGCDCQTPLSEVPGAGDWLCQGADTPFNSCTEIARRMLAFEGYSVEVEG